jgi:hypothetical protein
MFPESEQVGIVKTHDGTGAVVACSVYALDRCEEVGEVIPAAGLKNLLVS